MAKKKRKKKAGPRLPKGRELQFCLNYIRESNGVKAATDAGYSVRCAAQQACRMLTKVYIKDYIRKGLQQAAEDAIATRTDVLRELSRIALQDPKNMCDENGRLLPVCDMPEDARRTISGIKTRTRNGIVEKEVRTWSKEKALNDLGRHHKLFTDKIDISVKISLAERVKKARQRTGKK